MISVLIRFLSMATLGYLAGYAIGRIQPDPLVTVVLFVIVFLGLNKLNKDLKVFLEEQKEK
jgi:hypothetical protein